MKRLAIALALLMVMLPVVQADNDFYRERHIPLEITVEEDTHIDFSIGLSIADPDYYFSNLHLHSIGVGIIGVDEETQYEEFHVFINATFLGVERNTSAYLGYQDYLFLTEIDWHFVPPPFLRGYIWSIPASVTVVGNSSLSGGITLDLVYEYTIWARYSDPTSPPGGGSPLFVIFLAFAILIPLILCIEAYKRWRRNS